MKSINWPRMLIGGAIAGILFFVGDGVVHGVLLKSYWMDIVKAMGKPMPEDPAHGMVYHLLHDFAKGFAAIFLYAAMRPRLGKGPMTAVIAGLVVWGLAIPTALCGMIPIEWFGRKFALLWSLYAIIPSAIAAIGGAALYKEAD
jgi:hypothetical protein